MQKDTPQVQSPDMAENSERLTNSSKPFQYFLTFN